VWGGQGPYKDCRATDDDDEQSFMISTNHEAGPRRRAVWGVGLDHLVAKIVGSNPVYGLDVFFFLCCALLYR
jgi:hypothetical protein